MDHEQLQWSQRLINPDSSRAQVSFVSIPKLLHASVHGGNRRGIVVMHEKLAGEKILHCRTNGIEASSCSRSTLLDHVSRRPLHGCVWA